MSLLGLDNVHVTAQNLVSHIQNICALPQKISIQINHFYFHNFKHRFVYVYIPSKVLLHEEHDVSLEVLHSFTDPICDLGCGDNNIK